MSLLQFPRSRIQILSFIIFHDVAKGNVPRVVVDASSSTWENVVFVEDGDESAVSGVDEDLGRWDGSSFGSWHDACLCVNMMSARCWLSYNTRDVRYSDSVVCIVLDGKEAYVEVSKRMYKRSLSSHWNQDRTLVPLVFKACNVTCNSLANIVCWVFCVMH